MIDTKSNIRTSGCFSLLALFASNRLVFRSATSFDDATEVVNLSFVSTAKPADRSQSCLLTSERKVVACQGIAWVECRDKGETENCWSCEGRGVLVVSLNWRAGSGSIEMRMHSIKIDFYMAPREVIMSWS